MLCLGKSGAGRLWSPLLGWSACRQWSRNIFGKEHKVVYAPSVRKNASCNRVCWLNTKSDIVKSKITEVGNWIHLYFFSPGCSTMSENIADECLFCHYWWCPSFYLWMRSLYFTVTTLQGNDLLLLSQSLLQLSLHNESVWLQVPNTEELLADPVYQTAVFAYLRRENQKMANKKVSVSRREIAKKEELCNGHNGIPTHLLRSLPTISPSPVLTRLLCQ